MISDIQKLEEAFEEGDFDLLDELLPPLLAQNVPAAIRIQASYWRADVPEEECERLYKEGMFKAAALGDLQAKYQVGVFYDLGEYGVPQDKRKASEIFKELAELGNPHCAWIYACEQIWGSEAVPKDTAKGLALLEDASAMGSSEACITIASFHHDGSFGYEKSIAKRDEYREKALALDETTFDPFA